MEYDGADRRSPERWKIKKEISIADLVSFSAAALAVIYAYTTLDKRTTILEAAALETKAMIARQDETALRTQARIDIQLDKMNDKLDRIATHITRNSNGR